MKSVLVTGGTGGRFVRNLAHTLYGTSRRHHIRILITGGTGSLGQALTRTSLRRDPDICVVVFSRCEYKQAMFAESLDETERRRVRFFLGDVRDVRRLKEACWGCDVVVHAAALKRLDALAYNPGEAVRTNVLGTENVIEAAITTGVRRVIVISSDKAVHAVNGYGASKFLAEWCAVRANAVGVPRGTRISVLRYGNVMASRGSVVEIFRRAVAQGRPIPLTDRACTRFWLTLDTAVALVLRTLEFMEGGEIVVPLLPSLRITDLAQAIAPGHPTEIIGLRAGGEKIHERLLNDEEISRTGRIGDLFLVNPAAPSWRYSPCDSRVPSDFCYDSASHVGGLLSVVEITNMLGTL